MSARRLVAPSAPRLPSVPAVVPSWRSTADLNLDDRKMNRLVQLHVNIATANDEAPREVVAEIARVTKQGASNIQLGRGGSRGYRLLLLMAGFPALQKTLTEILRRYPRDPNIVDRKIAELEAQWRALGGEGEP